MKQMISLSKMFEKYGPQPFLFEPEREIEISYSQLDDYSAVVAGMLSSQGVIEGDRILLFFDNCVEFVIAYFATLRLKAIAVPLQINYEPARLEYVIAQTKPAMILYQAGCPMPVKQVQNLALDYRTIAATTSVMLETKDFSTEDTIAILYTSGTTGQPKGALLQWGHFIENIADYGIDLGIDSNTRFIVSMPITHIDGWTYSTLQPFIFGASAVVTATFSAKIAATFDQFLNVRGGNVFVCVPSMLSGLLAMRPRLNLAPVGALDFVICGSSKMTPELKAQFEAGFHTTVLENYGSTEALLVAYYTKDIPYKPNSVGKVPVKCRVRIQQNGEIAISSPYVFKEYYRDSARTSQVFQDGWYLIGDMGRIDADGYLFLMGRRQDTINKAGIKIDPTEIDEIIAAHPAVLESATIGIENQMNSQDIYSFVRVSMEVCDLLEHIKKNLPSIKWPKKIIYVPRLPKNQLGKVVREDLLKLKIDAIGA